jgi:hypothetical protein
MSKTLSQITKQLGSAHRAKSTAEKELKESRGKFFDAVDEEIVATETLAQQTVGIPTDVESAEAYVRQFHPGWRIVGDEPEEGAETALIEEDPAFKKFVYVNHDDGYVYRRNVSQGGPSLDNERLKAENPKLWKRITEERVQPATKVRVLKDLDTEISNDDLAAMQEYFVPGSMTVKLDAPRKAKPDELDA